MPNETVSRIQAACRELEMALENFNQADDDIAGFDKRAPTKTAIDNLSTKDLNIKRIHSQLSDIRKQLDELSK